MTRFEMSPAVRGRWLLAGLVVSMLSFGASAHAAFSWTQVPNDGTHYTQSGPALTEVVADPCSANAGLEQIHMFAIKDDGYVWENIGDPGSWVPEYKGPWSWEGWQSNCQTCINYSTECGGPNVPCQFSGSNPSTAAFTLVTSAGQAWSDQLAVVTRQTTTQVAYINLRIGDPNECGDRAWLGWSPIPGTWVNDVAVAFWYPYLYVFGEGSNGMMFMTRVDASAFAAINWSTPVAIPNGWFNAGAAATVVDGIIFVSGRGNDNNYYWSSSTDGANFSSWSELPPTGAFSSAPAISSWSGGHLDVSGVGLSSVLWRATSDNYGQTWTAFSQSDNAITHYQPASFSFYGNFGVTRLAQTEGYYPQYGTVREGDGP